MGLFDPNDEEVEDSSDEEIVDLTSLPPEMEVGNVEYKLKLVNPSQSRFEHLVTQMKWRLQEGGGEAIYEIGVKDCGDLEGLEEQDLEASLNTLKRMAEKLNASMHILREHSLPSSVTMDNLSRDNSPFDVATTTEMRRSASHQIFNGSMDSLPRKRALEVLVRKVPDDQHFIDLRMAVLGNADAGKSTLLGVLTHGELDNGQGRARLNLFRHLHEIQTGRTSCISHEILGFNEKGEVLNYQAENDYHQKTAEEICTNASKVITLMDLAGHPKYMKTTVFGLTGYAPHFAMLVVSANTGLIGTTREHLGYALALEVPIFVVVSKLDLCSRETVETTLAQLQQILSSPGCKKVPFRVTSTDTALTAASSLPSKAVCPIFEVSSVRGDGIDLLLKFLHALPPLKSSKVKEEELQDPCEFQVDEIFNIPNLGSIVGGRLVKGVIQAGDFLLLGPSQDGRFVKVQIQSLHRNRAPCRTVQAGQAATLALGESYPKSILRKGSVLLKSRPQACADAVSRLLVCADVGSPTSPTSTSFPGPLLQASASSAFGSPSKFRQHHRRRHGRRRSSARLLSNGDEPFDDFLRGSDGLAASPFFPFDGQLEEEGAGFEPPPRACFR